jgi:(E)-4-hydroxy-3-methylbut-2-enyl-diphosphate synthase
LPTGAHHRPYGERWANLKNIVAELRSRDCHVPIVADIHFKPDAALEAARWVE